MEFYLLGNIKAIFLVSNNQKEEQKEIRTDRFLSRLAKKPINEVTIYKTAYSTHTQLSR